MSAVTLYKFECKPKQTVFNTSIRDMAESWVRLNGMKYIVFRNLKFTAHQQSGKATKSRSEIIKYNENKNQGRIKGAIGAIDPPKTYESNFIHYDFVQFGKQHSRYKAILPSTVFSPQCCEVYFVFLTVVNP